MSSKNVKGSFRLGPPVFKNIDILLAISCLCTWECSTPDFITPVDQQFAIDLDNKVVYPQFWELLVIQFVLTHLFSRWCAYCLFPLNFHHQQLNCLLWNVGQFRVLTVTKGFNTVTSEKTKIRYVTHSKKNKGSSLCFIIFTSCLSEHSAILHL